MGIDAIFDHESWSRVPFHFWSLMFFAFGTIVGSFLNVVIHRLPLEQSVVSPPSHCPHCKYSIPWFLNIPLVTWLWLGGKCKNCGAPISVRYFLVELLTGIAFLGCWLKFGGPPATLHSALLALVYCLVLAGLIAATFIDFEHLIIPDQITIGGIFAGVICSFFFPALHGEQLISLSLKKSIIGAAFGGGLIYFIVRLGKLAFGRFKEVYSVPVRVIFSESELILPDRSVKPSGLRWVWELLRGGGMIPKEFAAESILYGDIFYRSTDTIHVRAIQAELPDRCYQDVRVSLKPDRLQVGDDSFAPEQVPCLEVLTEKVVLPREAMGLGDVKFMAAIGAFLGWQSVFFCLLASSILGALMALVLSLVKKQWLSRVAYGPYIAIAAVIWIFGGRDWWNAVLTLLENAGQPIQ